MKRSLGRWFNGLVVAAGLSVASAATAAPITPTAPASKFYNSLGINGHVWYANTIWYKRLVELGVPNLRGKIATNRGAADQLKPFFASGGKLNASIVASSGGTLNKDEATRNIAFLKNYIGVQNLSGIEGPNEFNASSGTVPNWATVERDFVKWTHDTVRADPAFNGVPLIAPSVYRRLTADYAALGDLSAWVDEGCIHYYSGDRRPPLTGSPSFTMEASLKAASVLAPGKPIRMTESGWQAVAGTMPITLRAQAKYVVRDYFDSFSYGVPKTFMYQIQDDQTNLWGLTDPNGNPKPAFLALKNLVQLVRDTGTSSGTVGYTISGAPPTLKSYSFTRSDGSALIAFYLDVDSWNKSTKKDVETSVPVTVTLSAPASKVEVFQPTFNSAAIATGSGSTISTPATDQLTIIRVTR